MLLEIQYIGEHLMPGKIGQLAITLAFVSSLLAAAAYLFATYRRDRPEFSNWNQIGRGAFSLHALSVLTIFGTLFYMMVQQYYEYQYVFNHVNEDLPFQFIFSAFWEGQEGSFLLWMFWHAVLGVFLMFTARKWEAPVLGTLALIEVFLSSMILGVYIGLGDEPFKLGSSPFLLLRDTLDAPIFAKADYLELIKGTGLNPLLQNYWMTIHPPTLFLGFASTSIPFAFAIGGLLTQDHKGWLKPALPWALFSAAILGTGILMGGAWAYEALSFGGYWAWDPVENMSLVPWLILIAGIHTNLIARNTQHSIRSTYVFYVLTFILILYSTFLTRSGVLGDTSVHAFTEMGLEWQLIAFIAFFTLLGFIPYFAQYGQIPAPKKEEATPSKEFWMFIGALVLMFSAVMITASTSLPVYNKIYAYFDPTFEGQVITDPIAHYNKYQLWIGVFIGLLSGGAQYLRWREPNWQNHLRKFGIHMLGALVITGGLTFLGSLWINIISWQYGVLLFSGIFTVVTNLDYLISFARRNLKMAGSVMAHVGFGLMIVGVLASGLNKFHISTNPFAQRGLIEEERLDRNIMLFKNMPMYMSGYQVTYVRDSFENNNRIYEVNFKELDENGQVTNEFNLYPTALYDNKITKVAAYNPSTKHYAHKDIFTHIASIPLKEADAEFARAKEDSLQYRTYNIPSDRRISMYDTIAVRDSFIIRRYDLKVLGINQNPSHAGYTPQEGDITIGADIEIYNPRKDTSYLANPMLALRGSLVYTYPVQVQPASMKVRLNEAILDQFIARESELPYETIIFKQGESKEWNGKTITFAGFNKKPEHPNYLPEEGDIAVSAIVQVDDPETDSSYLLQPVYLIRGSRPFNLKAETLEAGIHMRFLGLDPVEETLELAIAQRKPELQNIPVGVAYSPRTDFLVLEAIVFPGINFFWLGTILMMVGFLFSMFNRIRTRYAQA